MLATDFRQDSDKSKDISDSLRDQQKEVQAASCDQQPQRYGTTSRQADQKQEVRRSTQR